MAGPRGDGSGPTESEGLFHGPVVAPLQHADPGQGAVPADRFGERADVCLRPDGLRRGPYRQRAPDHRVSTCCSGLLRHSTAPRRSPTPATSPTWTTRSTRWAQERGISIRELTDGTLAQFHADIRGPRRADGAGRQHSGRPPGLRRAAGDRPTSPRWRPSPSDWSPPATPSRRRPRPVRRALDAGLRCAVEASPRRDGGRGPGRRRAYNAHALDFVLWKPSKPGEPSWPSPCGIVPPGRPGWPSSARRWRGGISARPSTSMPAASTSCFPTTRTRSR